MRKTIIPIILGIALISLASAMYAGDCLEVDLSEMESLDNVVYDVVGNSSNLEGLTIELNGTIVNICTVPNYKPDSFTIIFIDNSTKTIVKEVYVGGGSTTKYETEYVYRNVTEYIDRDTDKIIYSDTEDKVCQTCEEPEFNFIPWIFLGLIIVYMVISVLTSWSRKKKIKEEEEIEINDIDWKEEDDS